MFVSFSSTSLSLSRASHVCCITETVLVWQIDVHAKLIERGVYAGRFLPLFVPATENERASELTASAVT